MKEKTYTNKNLKLKQTYTVQRWERAGLSKCTEKESIVEFAKLAHCAVNPTTDASQAYKLNWVCTASWKCWGDLNDAKAHAQQMQVHGAPAQSVIAVYTYAENTNRHTVKAVYERTFADAFGSVLPCWETLDAEQQQLMQVPAQQQHTAHGTPSTDKTART